MMLVETEHKEILRLTLKTVQHQTCGDRSPFPWTNPDPI